MSTTITDISLINAATRAEPASAHAVSMPRLQSIDVVRGLVMVLMALDHVRDYISAAHFDLLDPALTTPGLYATRWITHLCAPTFIFLAGVSASLLGRTLTPQALCRFLLLRGAWMVVLELTVVRFTWMFTLSYEMGLFLQVIWAIGISMMVVGLLVRLPHTAVLLIAIMMIAGHNLLDTLQPSQLGAWAPLWQLLHVQGPAAFGFIAYPVIPWIGVMALGYALGPVYEIDASRRRTLLWRAGAIALSLFALLRGFNLYGDPQPWRVQADAMATVFSFLDVEKYPPSLHYLLLMLGAAAWLLAAFETASGRWVQILRTFGRVPLFFYVLHVALAHLLAGVIGMATGFGTQLLTQPFVALPRHWGYGLPMVYATWLLVVTALYPLCGWFGRVKARKRARWLAYV